MSNNKIIFYSASADSPADSAKNTELINSLETAGYYLDRLTPDNFSLEKIADQEILFLVFMASGENIFNNIFNNTFELVQKFIQLSIKKRLGKIIFLVDSNANGLEYKLEENNIQKNNILNFASQGALTGLCKTINKEYSKRGIQSNLFYIDWRKINLNNINSLVEFLKSSLSSKELFGQVITLDCGRFS